MHVQVENLVKQYTSHETALQEVSFSIESGTTVSVVGQSGCGKSTLLNLLGGLDQPTAGRILLDNQDLTALSQVAKDRLRLREISFVYQFFHLLPHLSLRENTLLPALQAQKQTPVEIFARCEELFRTVGLLDHCDKVPAQVSGGMMSRAALVRAVLTQPRLILADEPTGNLDSKTGERVLDLLLTEQKKNAATLILVTHNGAAAERCTRKMHFQDGRLIGD